jgi:hypothetical protein
LVRAGAQRVLYGFAGEWLVVKASDRIATARNERGAHLEQHGKQRTTETRREAEEGKSNCRHGQVKSRAKTKGKSLARESVEKVRE